MSGRHASMSTSLRPMLALAAFVLLSLSALAQTLAQTSGPTVAPAGTATAEPDRRESIEADVSTRNISVETDFTGSQVVVFGTIENSRQISADQGLYDIAVVIEGPREALQTRRKSNVAGIWINTSMIRFDDVPSYYALVTTRPVTEIAPKPVLYQHGIGFENLRFQTSAQLGVKELEDFREAIFRIKRRQSLYLDQPRGVAFIGRSLFRASVDLPANVSVGQFTAWIYLFRGGDLLSTFKTKLGLERGGFEREVHNLAFRQPFVYGLAAVGFALVAGLLASMAFRRN
ncbi:MAG: TIGR02186 family protein [Hyphomicrobiaceae bacterium]